MARKQRGTQGDQSRSISRPFVPKNDEQRECAEIIRENDIVFIESLPGAGKSHIAAAIGAEGLISGKYKQLIVTRPQIALEDMGFLPDDIDSKCLPYMTPILTELKYYINVENEIKANRLILQPIAFIRGITWKNCYCLIDEFYNLEPNQLKTILTRIGENSKLVFTGDPSQSDLSAANTNKISEMLNKLDNVACEENKIAFSTLTKSVRNPIIEVILKALGE